MKPVVVFGATGYTGKLIVQSLLDMGVADVILGGRNQQRLQRLADQHDGLPVRVADVNRPETLTALLRDAHVVINAVGPFVRFGEPVVRAAIEHGVHYLDITAEQSYMVRIRDEYDSAARAKGIAIVNAQGLEFAVGMCAAALLAEADSSIETIDIFTRVDNHAWSQGSSKSSLGAIFQEQLELRDAHTARRTATLLPRKVIMPDRGIVELSIPFPGAEALHLGRACPSVRNATGNLIMPNGQAMAAMAIIGLTPILQLLIRPPLLAAIGRQIDRGPEGPDPTQRLAQTFAVLARGLTGQGAGKEVMVSGADAYGVTGIIAALGARLLVADGPCATGVISTPEAFGAGPFLHALESWDIRTTAPQTASELVATASN